MIILKLLIVILLTLFIWLMLQLVLSVAKVFSFFRHGVRQAGRTAPQQNTMVKCATCNLYLLDADAVAHNGQYFCSLDHARSKV